MVDYFFYQSHGEKVNLDAFKAFVHFVRSSLMTSLGGAKLRKCGRLLYWRAGTSPEILGLELNQVIMGSGFDKVVMISGH